MSALLRSSSRLFSTISRRNRRFSSNVASEPPKETIMSSSILGDQPPPLNDLPPPLPEPEAVKSSWSLLKYGIIAAVTGTAATAGYATYACLRMTAYSSDEIDQKIKALRASPSISIRDVDSKDKIKEYLRTTAMSVTVKAVDVYLDLRRLTEEHIRGFTEPTSDKLLPDLLPQEHGAFTLVLDLNETLVYSDWKRERGWRTFKRPGVDDFLEHLAQFYEIVLYSDQQNVYVDQVLERLDPKHYIRYKLARSETRYMDGKHYRDLSKLNRNPAKVLYVSGHALETSLQAENCVPINAWQGEAEDTTLVDLIPFLEYVAIHRPADIRAVLASYQGHDIPKEFIERSKEHLRKMQEQKQHSRPWRLR